MELSSDMFVFIFLNFNQEKVWDKWVCKLSENFICNFNFFGWKIIW